MRARCYTRAQNQVLTKSRLDQSRHSNPCCIGVVSRVKVGVAGDRSSALWASLTCVRTAADTTPSTICLRSFPSIQLARRSCGPGHACLRCWALLHLRVLRRPLRRPPPPHRRRHSDVSDRCTRGRSSAKRGGRSLSSQPQKESRWPSAPHFANQTLTARDSATRPVITSAACCARVCGRRTCHRSAGGRQVGGQAKVCGERLIRNFLRRN
jgi:hypothetical protein